MRAEPFADLAGNLDVSPGSGALALSPGGRYLLCRLRGQRRGDGGRKTLVLEAASGKQLAAVQCRSTAWSADGEKLYYNRYEELRCLELPGGRETVLFTAGDYFKGAPPKTHEGWTWSPRPVATLKNGGLAVDVCEAPGSGLEGKRMPPGVVIITGEMFTWSRKEGKNVFSKLGPTRSGLHGRIRYIPMGREGLLLRAESTRGFHKGKMILQLVKADTGKVLLDIKLPQKLKAGGQEATVSYGLAAADPQGDIAVFSASGRITKPIDPQGKRFASFPHWFGLFTVEVAAGTFRRIELPFGRRPEDIALSPNGDLLLMVGAIKTEGGKRHAGLWLCAPDGKGMVCAEAGTQAAGPAVPAPARKDVF